MKPARSSHSVGPANVQIGSPTPFTGQVDYEPGAASFPDSLSRRFAELPVTHRVHVLSQLLRTAGPLALGVIAQGAFTRCAARSGWERLSITGEDAIDATPEQVRDLARYAEQAEPGIASRVRALLEQANRFPSAGSSGTQRSARAEHRAG